MKAMKIGNSQQ